MVVGIEATGVIVTDVYPSGDVFAPSLCEQANTRRPGIAPAVYWNEVEPWFVILALGPLR